MTEKMLQLRIDLENDTKEMFEKIKKKYNLEHNTETVRLIIKIAYDKIFSK